jgi:PDZ domain
MKKFVRFALAALFLLGIASAQNIPAMDVFAGYSYLSFHMPANAITSFSSAETLALNGWDLSLSVGLLHHLAVEGDFSGHQLSDCGGTILNCSNLSYMGGVRFNVGNRSRKLTGFVHGLVGQDRMDLPEISSGTSVSDTSVAFAGGGGIDYWFLRQFGIRFGPADFIYTHHLNNDGVSSQNSYRVGGGIVFRFGRGAYGEPSPKPTRAPSGSQPATVAVRQPAAVSVPGRGMSIPALGVLVAPQEFDGAKVLEIVPGGVAEMASMKPGDLIRSVDGKAVRTPMELAAELLDKAGKVRIGFQRGDFATETVVILH